MSYQQPSDLARVPEARALAKTEADAFLAFHEAAFRDGGAVSRKYRELVALAVATAAGCPYCIDTHTRGATVAGASREEMTEVSFVAAAVCGGATVAHTLLGLRLHEEMEGQDQPTGDHVHG